MLGASRWRRRGASIALAVLAGVWFGCAAQPHSRQPPSTVILVSLDGFAARFLDSALTPAIARLAAEGVRAEGLVPVFPTKTFPNHYSMVTGLYAEHHGVVANTMYDPAFDAWFRLSDREAVSDARWWGGEPLWVTVENHGKVAAAFFWPGTEAEIAGVRPTYWMPYDGGVPNAERVRQVLAWLDLPEDRRPTFITVYFSDVDDELHDHGIDAPEAREALRRVDTAIGQLVEGLEERQRDDRVNLVIVADHGMAALSSDRVIYLDDYIDLETVRVSDWTPVAAIWPLADTADGIYRALARAGIPWTVYRKTEIPDRLHYREHRRIAPIIAIADEGWSIARRERFTPSRYTGATHGYDNALASMQALFVARGPAFETGLVVPPFQNVHVYELLAAVLGVQPAANDGSLDSVRMMLSGETVRDGVGW